MPLTVRSVNCMKATWVEPVRKKKNAKTAITGVIAEMPKVIKPKYLPIIGHDYDLL